MRASSKGKGLLAGLVRQAIEIFESLGVVRRFARERAVAKPNKEQRAVRYSGSADERTIRRVAEMQDGGMSSAESAARYASGDNPGGTHRKAAHRGEGRWHQRPTDEEPEGHKERVPGGDRHMPETRRG